MASQRHSGHHRETTGGDREDGCADITLPWEGRGSRASCVPCSGEEGTELPGDCCLPGNHACPEDDLARALLHLHGLQDTHSEQGLLHGGRGALL